MVGVTNTVCSHVKSTLVNFVLGMELFSIMLLAIVMEFSLNWTTVVVDICHVSTDIYKHHRSLVAHTYSDTDKYLGYLVTDQYLGFLVT